MFNCSNIKQKNNKQDVTNHRKLEKSSIDSWLMRFTSKNIREIYHNWSPWNIMFTLSQISSSSSTIVIDCKRSLIERTREIHHVEILSLLEQIRDRRDRRRVSFFTFMFYRLINVDRRHVFYWSISLLDSLSICFFISLGLVYINEILWLMIWNEERKRERKFEH